MAKCKYCGRSAGWFDQVHAQCQSTYERAEFDLLTTAAGAAISGKGWDDLDARLRTIAGEGYRTETDIGNALVRGWLAGVEEAFEDGVLTPEESNRLHGFYEHTGILGYVDRQQMDRELGKPMQAAFLRMRQSLALQMILLGALPSIDENTPIPFNLTRSEQIAWVFPDCMYMEEATSRGYAGASAGVSVKVASGLYYHTNAFKGQPIQTAYLKHVDSGVVGVTTEHIYFAGPVKTLRVPYSKMVGFRPYTDGLGIWRDAVSAKQQVFVTGDGWFIYNLVANLAKRQKE